MISEKLNASKANNLLNQSKTMSMERHDQELSLDQLKTISAGIDLNNYIGVDMNLTVDRCNIARPSWHKLTSTWKHPRCNIRGKVHARYEEWTAINLN